MNTVIPFYLAMFVLPALIVAGTCLAAARHARRGPGSAEAATRGGPDDRRGES